MSWNEYCSFIIPPVVGGVGLPADVLTLSDLSTDITLSDNTTFVLAYPF